MNEEVVARQLKKLIIDINFQKKYEIVFNRQEANTKRMSLTGAVAKGRLGVYPCSEGCDISLSGKSIQQEMYDYMRNLCGKERDGFIQPNQPRGTNNQPFWRVTDFELVRKAAFHYAERHII